MHLGSSSSSLNLRLRSTKLAVSGNTVRNWSDSATCIELKGNEPDIVSDAGIEQNAILRDDTNGLTQTLLGDIANVLTVDENAALSFLEVVLPEKQAEDGALPRTALANQRNGMALGDAEGNVT